MVSLISYHRRDKHSGCIYRKAGFKKWGIVKPPQGAGWGSRERAESTTREQAHSKRRWRLDLGGFR